MTREIVPSSKLICIFLAAALAVAMLPVAALANPTNEASNSQSGAGQSQAAIDDFASSAVADGSSTSEFAAGNLSVDGLVASDPDAQYAALATDGKISVSLDYSATTLPNGSIKCGVPVTFTLNASGGSGTYKYLLGSLSLAIDGTMQTVYSNLHGSLIDDNTFTYTFSASGTYSLYWTAFDAANLANMNRVIQNIIVDDPSCPSVETLAQNVVNACNAKGYTTEYDKALYYYSYIIDSVDYDYDYNATGALGVFAGMWVEGPDGNPRLVKKAVCEGYYQAYAMLLNRSGIQCVRTPANNHVWATVRLDGIWTQVDPTKDDSSGAPFKNIYFGITDEMSELVHDGYTRNASYPCTSYAANYLYRSGQVEKAASEFSAQINTNISAGQKNFKLVVGKYAPYQQPYHVFYPMVVSELQKKSWSEYNLSISYVKDTSNIPFSLNDSYVKVEVICPHDALSDWQSDGDSHWRQCAKCDSRVSNKAHSYGAWVKKSSNLFFDSSQSRTCSVCGYVQTSVLKALLPQQSAYAVVFDSVYYSSTYGDIRNAFGSDEVSMFWHFVNNGIAEGRRGNDAFDVVSYYNANPDLRRAFGTSLKALYSHYLGNGVREGRCTSGVPTLVGSITFHGGVNYSPVYDGSYYASVYSDVRNAFTRRIGQFSLLDDVALLAHFVNFGMIEGRRGNDAFDVVSYYNANPDLRRAFGANLRSLYMHYISNGIREGRTVSAVPSLCGFLSVNGGTNYAPVYDGAYYAATNGDVRAYCTRRVGGLSLLDDTALLAHFVNFGMAEGRHASVAFSVQSYRARYGDLQVAFGSNLRSYYMHYINHGRGEGRMAI